MDGGGIGEIVPRDGNSDVLDEVTVVKDADLAGNASLGIAIDRDRNRLLVAVADLLGNRYSALAAYELSTWRRIFLAELSGHSKLSLSVSFVSFRVLFSNNVLMNVGIEKSFADDVAIDAHGNAYVTDAKGSKIWKVDVSGELVSTIESPLFTPPGWYNNLVALNGIVYHPDGFLVVIHTFSGFLYKIDLTGDGDDGNKVTVIEVNGGTLRFGDGLELLSPTKIVVAGNSLSSDCIWIRVFLKNYLLCFQVALLPS